MANTTKGFPYPELSDDADVPSDILALASAVDSAPGIAPLSSAAIAALSGGALWAGRLVYNSTTGVYQRYTGAAWVNFPGDLAASRLIAPLEPVTISATGASGTITMDALTSPILLRTGNATGNWTLNVRGNGSTTLNSLLAVGDSLTVVTMMQQGTTAYYASGFQVDGSAVTPLWQYASAPTAGNPSSLDAYSYTIIKTDSAPTYRVLASRIRFA